MALRLSVYSRSPCSCFLPLGVVAMQCGATIESTQTKALTLTLILRTAKLVVTAGQFTLPL